MNTTSFAGLRFQASAQATRKKKQSEKHWKAGNYEVNIDCHLFCHDELQFFLVFLQQVSYFPWPYTVNSLDPSGPLHFTNLHLFGTPRTRKLRKKFRSRQEHLHAQNLNSLAWDDHRMMSRTRRVVLGGAIPPNQCIAEYNHRYRAYIPTQMGHNHGPWISQFISPTAPRSTGILQ